MDEPDPRRRFSGCAAGYARHRPGYPAALVDWLIAETGVRPGEAVADVGCGTGILTRLLAERGLRAVGLDPNPEMLAEARQAGGPARYLRAEAAATAMAGGSIALVTVAQAFHWLDQDAAIEEFARVLRPGGRVAAIYNLRAEGAFMDAYDALLRRFSSQYQVVESWQATLDALRTHPLTAGHREWLGRNEQRFDFDGLHGRVWSSSYVFRGVADRLGFDRTLRELFEEHARGGLLDFPYRCIALLFRVISADSG